MHGRLRRRGAAGATEVSPAVIMGEPLFIVNRSGTRPSHEGAAASS